MARNDHTTGGDDFFLVLGGMLLVAIGLFYVWWVVKHEQISWAIVHLVKLESELALKFNWALFPEYEIKMLQLEDYCSRIDPKILGLKDLWILQSIGGINLWPFMMPPMVWMAISAYRAPTARQFNKILDFEGLLRRNAPHFPAIKPVIDLKLLDGDPDKGPWARMKTYIGFALEWKLLGTKLGIPITEFAPDIEAYQYDKKRAEKAFALQLGPKIGVLPVIPKVPQLSFQDRLLAKLGVKPKQVEAMSDDAFRAKYPHTYGLLAVFASRIARDIKAANSLLNHMSNTFQAPQKPGDPYCIDVAPAIPLFRKNMSHPIVKAILAKHGFISTAMVELLERARLESGVLKPADFLWLKPLDRTLWYTLHQVGMRVGNVEASGVRAHYLAELVHGGPLDQPFVEQAVIGLQEALSSEGWIAQDARDVYLESEKIENVTA